MFGMFFLGALYLQRVLGYDARADRPRVPARVALGIGALSLGFSARLITRFGARAVLLPGLAADRRRAGAVRRARRSTATTSRDVLPAMLLLGVGAGPRLPGADDAGDVGRDAERLGPGLRPRQHDPAGRRRARPRRARHARRPRARSHLLADGEQRGVGADRRLPPRVRASAPGLVVAAIVVAALVLRSERVALQEAPAVETATEELAYREAA